MTVEQGKRQGETLAIHLLKCVFKENQEAGSNKYIQRPLLLQLMGFFDIQEKINLCLWKQGKVLKVWRSLERRNGGKLGRSSWECGESTGMLLYLGEFGSSRAVSPRGFCLPSASPPKPVWDSAFSAFCVHPFHKALWAFLMPFRPAWRQEKNPQNQLLEGKSSWNDTESVFYQ